MAKIEVDEEEVRASTQLRGAVATLWANPEARKLIQKAQKIVDPKAKTPDLDQEEVVLAPVKGLEKKFDDFVAATQAEKAEAEKNRKIAEMARLEAEGIAQLRRAGWMDEGIKAVKAKMDEKGLLDPIDAAKLVDQSAMPQSPVTPGGVGAWNFTEVPAEGADFIKKLIETKGANDMVVDNEVRSVLNETRGSSLRR
jgi:hypothetical protein